MDIAKPEKLDLLKKMLDYSATRQKALAYNIANVDTPNFKRIDVEFDRELESAIKSGDEGAIQKLGMKLVKPDDTAVREDGNNVDIDIEMAKLSQNSMLFNIYATLLKKKLDGIKAVIKG